MRKQDVKLGNEYQATVSGNRVPVRIQGESPYGGWVGVNSVTGRQVRIKTAGRLKEMPHREHCPQCGFRTPAASLGLSVCRVCAGVE